MVQYYYIQTNPLERIPLEHCIKEYPDILNALADAYIHMRDRTGNPIALIDNGVEYDPKMIAQQVVEQFGDITLHEPSRHRQFRGKNWKLQL